MACQPCPDGAFCVGGRIQPVPCGEGLYSDIVQQQLTAGGNLIDVMRGALNSIPGSSGLPSNLGHINATLSPVMQQILKQGIDLDAFCKRGKGFWGDKRFPLEFYECDNCKGGVEFKCDGTHRGRLCAQCADGHFNMGTLFIAEVTDPFNINFA